MAEKLKLSLGKVARISLNRPEKKNALDSQLLTELKEAVESVKSSEAGSLVLSGEGNIFCAGLDRELLMSLTSYSENDTRQLIGSAQNIVFQLRNLKIPVIAAVKGHAIGAGMQLALAADIRLASPGSIFCFREPEFGIIPDMGALYILPRLIGEGLTKDMVFNRREVEAEEGKRIGLVNEIYDDLEKGIKEYVEKLLLVPTTPLKEAKALINSGWVMDFQDSLERTIESQIKCIRRLKQT
jgi:enoyl-CoA hydratase/carnithine racemase